MKLDQYIVRYLRRKLLSVRKIFPSSFIYSTMNDSDSEIIIKKDSSTEDKIFLTRPNLYYKFSTKSTAIENLPYI
jgi:hypothetical protein